MICVTRKTTESNITVGLAKGPVAADYRKKINTPLTFLNHMIEHIVWRSGLNIEVSVELDRFFLAHVVAEDLGQTVGRAIAAYYRQMQMEGMVGYGDAIGIIDEAKATCAVSFENRSLFCYTSAVPVGETCEGMQSEDLLVFLDGICQGAGITMHLDVEKGENGHHIWEAAFRSVGMALGRAMAIDESRKAMTAGVAGKVEFTVDGEA